MMMIILILVPTSKIVQCIFGIRFISKDIKVIAPGPDFDPIYIGTNLEHIH